MISFVIRNFNFSCWIWVHKGTCRAHEERENTQQGFPGRRRSRRWLRRWEYQRLLTPTVKRFLNERGRFGKTDKGSPNGYLSLRFFGSPVSIYIKYIHRNWMVNGCQSGPKAAKVRSEVFICLLQYMHWYFFRSMPRRERTFWRKMVKVKI